MSLEPCIKRTSRPGGFATTPLLPMLAASELPGRRGSLQSGCRACDGPGAAPAPCTHPCGKVQVTISACRTGIHYHDHDDLPGGARTGAAHRGAPPAQPLLVLRNIQRRKVRLKVRRQAAKLAGVEPAGKLAVLLARPCRHAGRKAAAERSAAAAASQNGSNGGTKC